jgi:rhodanese-related sulfurtransferase
MDNQNHMTGNTSGQPITQISVNELAQRLASQDANVQLIDVREPQELAIAQIDGFVNLPLSEYAQWSEQVPAMFDPQAETLVLCHHGVRSAQMCQWLVTQGFTNVKNIAGGIAAYSLLVDSSIPQY